MSVVKDVVQEEYERLNELAAFYARKISELPVGSLSRKKRWNQEYYYRAYRSRESGKVKFEYLGKADSQKVQEFHELIEKRRSYEEKLRKTKEALEQVRRMLRAAGE